MAGAWPSAGRLTSGAGSHIDTEPVFEGLNLVDEINQIMTNFSRFL